MGFCIFCKIAEGSIPCSKIFENEQLIAFLDLNPAALGHALIVPKVHAETLLDLPAGYGESIIQVMQAVGRALLQEPGVDGFNCLQNNFPAAGQEVMHLHWHVIPRTKDDGVFTAWRAGKYASEQQMGELAKTMQERVLTFMR